MTAMSDSSMSEKPNSSKQKRGFALLSPERRRAIAKQGGEAVPAERRAFAQSRELAAKAGSIGGGKSRPKRPSE
jgi:general stress protein YciG